ncbi:MAG: hypothetical protein J6W13_06310 [Salinivirgaceae bacterium]|nr:hypothetical protein [Salinivirgaceae bacterium]
MKQKTFRTLTGLLCTAVLSFVVLFLIVGAEPLANSATNFTSAGGDALKDFYNTYYHVKYDTSLVRNNSMNYPYGEHYTYTGAQLYVSAPLQFLRRSFGVDCSSSVLLWINLLIWISILLGSVFLYLIFRELRVPILYSVLGAVAITYLSPQIDRLTAHLTLSYVFIVPCALFLFLRWFKTRQWKYTAFIALLTFVAGLVHPYYIFFIAVIWLFVCGYVFFYVATDKTARRRVVIHALLQFVIPFLLFTLLTRIGDDAADRTAIPWGFHAYRGRLRGLLTPVGRSYWSSNIEWESWTFIGYVALIVLASGMLAAVRKAIGRKWRQMLQVTDDTYLSIVFWAAFVLMIFSLGFPLDMLPQYCFNYIGPLSQLRAVGRFLWLMFYVLNIIAVYVVARKMESFALRTKIIVVCTVALLYGFDIYTFTCNNNYEHKNQLITDFDNELPENGWVGRIDVKQYQSILPLPMYSIGTEHIWLDHKAGMYENSLYVSMKTGLPLHSLYASRSRIQEAYRNIAFRQEPFLPFAVIGDMDSQRAVLVIAPSGLTDLNENEKRIISCSDSLFSENGIEFYSIMPSRLQQMQKDFAAGKKAEFLQKRLYERMENVYCDDSTAAFFVETWDNQSAKTVFRGDGAMVCKVNKWSTVYEGKNPTQTSGNLEVSFMISDYMSDLVGRTDVEVCVKDKDGQSKNYIYTDLFRCMQNIFYGWGKIVIPIPDLAPDDSFSIKLRNKMLSPSRKLYIDNLIIRPVDLSVILEDDVRVTMNNNVIEGSDL